MAIIILPDAQEDLLSLQSYMLKQWSESERIKAEDEIFAKLELVDSGLLTGGHIQELANVGNYNYRSVVTSHHRLVYQKLKNNVYVYAVAAHKQDFSALLVRRMLKF